MSYMSRILCGGKPTEADLKEINKFEKVLHIWSEIEKANLNTTRKINRRRAAYRLIYGKGNDCTF